MSNRTITKYAIYSIAILSATLINGLIIEYIKKRIHQSGYLMVFVDMLIVLLIFAPAFALVSKYSKKLSRVYVNTSNKLSANKNGRMIGFLIALLVLFALFAFYRHDLNVVQELRTRVR